MAFALGMQFLYNTPPGESVSANVRGCWINGSERGGAISRSIGLAGDEVTVTINPDDVPEDWDLEAGEFTIQFGHDTDYVLLGGYRAKRIWRASPGKRSSGDTPRPLLLHILLTTLPGMHTDGRSPMVRDRIRNIVNADGQPDETDDDYTTISALTDILLDAIGIAHVAAPAGMDTAMDGATALIPPGPLDWGNAVARDELSALLMRYGWAARMNLDGDEISVVRLLRGGETITVPEFLDGEENDLVEPYVLEPQRGVRAGTIVVTSGSTRSTIIDEILGQVGETAQLEWVALDERTGAWMNGSEWASAYPSEIAPGDIDAFKAGPTAGETTDRDLARLFSALRISDATLRAKTSAFVAIPVSLDIGAGSASDAPLGGSIGYIVGHGCARRSNQFTDWPAEDGEGDPQPTRIDGVQFRPDGGVFVLPGDLTWVRMAGGAGTYASAEEIDFADIRLVFAHEAREGDSAIDFYTSVWNVANTAGVLSVARVTNESLIADAIASGETAKVHSPGLRRFLGWNTTDEDPVPLNDTELDAIAEQIALAYAADEMIASGEIRIRGFHEITPGDWGGAVSGVEWSLADGERGGATIVRVNTHGTPGGEYDLLARRAGRSIGAGLGRYTLPGAWTERGDIGAAIAADMAQGGDGSTMTIQGAVARRGRERELPGGVAGGAAGAGGPLERGVAGHQTEAIWAVITGATSISAGRWAYDWTEVALNPGDDPPYTKPSGARSSETMPKALNTLEFNNDGEDLEGNDIDYTETVGTMALRPIGRFDLEAGIETVVRLYGPYGDGDDARMLFTLRNADDGECE